MTSKSEDKIPDEWKDDAQTGGSGDKKHADRRDCWCNPRLVSLPHSGKGGEVVFVTEVRHR